MVLRLYCQLAGVARTKSGVKSHQEEKPDGTETTPATEALTIEAFADSKETWPHTRSNGGQAQTSKSAAVRRHNFKIRERSARAVALGLVGVCAAGPNIYRCPYR